jgi:hypothetical protein
LSATLRRPSFSRNSLANLAAPLAANKASQEAAAAAKIAKKAKQTRPARSEPFLLKKTTFRRLGPELVNWCLNCCCESPRGVWTLEKQNHLEVMFGAIGDALQATSECRGVRPYGCCSSADADALPEFNDDELIDEFMMDDDNRINTATGQLHSCPQHRSWLHGMSHHSHT